MTTQTISELSHSHYDDLIHTPNLTQDLFSWASYFHNLLQSNSTRSISNQDFVVYKNPEFIVFLTNERNYIIQIKENFFSIRNPNDFLEVISNLEINQLHNHLLNRETLSDLLSVYI